MKVERPPIEGWILILEGKVELLVSDPQKLHIDAPSGVFMQLPREAFVLTAHEDSLLLLTVAVGDRPREGDSHPQGFTDAQR